MVAFKSVPGSHISELFPSYPLPDGGETHLYQRNGPFEQKARATHDPPAPPYCLSDLLLDELPHAPKPPAMHLSTNAHVSGTPELVMPDRHLLPIEEDDRMQRWGRLPDNGVLEFVINPFPEKAPPPPPPEEEAPPPEVETPWVFTTDTLVWKPRCKQKESWSKDFWVGDKVLKRKMQVSWARLEGKDQFKTFVEKTAPKGSTKDAAMAACKAAIQKHVRYAFKQPL
jgi:hypothetical protein